MEASVRYLVSTKEAAVRYFVVPWRLLSGTL
jgi:hypothetical protein